MIDKLIFDVTDAETLEDSANVGAHVRAGDDGALISSQDVNSQNWLNTASILYDEAGSAISDANPLAVSVKDGVNVEVDLSHVDDSVRLGDGTSFFTSTSENGDIALDVHISNLNIEVTQGTSPWVIGDGGGSITVDAVDLDIRDLSAAQDSVQSNLFDGAGTALTSTLVGADQALDVNIVASEELTVNDAALANTAIAHSQQAAAADDTAEDAVDSPLADRKYLYLYNAGNKKIAIGGTGVTTSTGFPISPGSYVHLRAGAAIDVQWAALKSAGSDLRALELS